MKIVISPWSRPLRSNKLNPKNYPFWPDVVRELRNKGHYVIQIGQAGEEKLDVDEWITDKTLKELTKIIQESDIWASVDNFLPHLCNLIGKKGVVLWGQSNPVLFGYPQNTNLLKDKKYLRPLQFDIWEAVEHNPESFVDAETVIKAII